MGHIQKSKMISTVNKIVLLVLILGGENAIAQAKNAKDFQIRRRNQMVEKKKEVTPTPNKPPKLSADAAIMLEQEFGDSKDAKLFDGNDMMYAEMAPMLDKTMTLASHDVDDKKMDLDKEPNLDVIIDTTEMNMEENEFEMGGI